MRVADRPVALQITATGRSTLQALAPLAALALALAVLVIVVPPRGEFPVDVDWNYARPVLTLVERGRLEISPWTASSLLLQVYWGALFATLFGFSHTVLRVSTLVLMAAATFGFYALLRPQLDATRALLATALLLFNPLSVALAYSFKTNIPFLALALWALVCAGRALRGARPAVGWLVAGSALAGGAYLVRQIAVALPLALLIVLCSSQDRRAKLSPRHLLAVLGPFALAVLIGFFVGQQRGPVKQEPLGWTLDFWVENGAGMIGVLLARFAATLAGLGLFTLPLSVGLLRSGRPKDLSGPRRCLLAVLLLGLLAGSVISVATFKQSPLALALGSTLTPRGMYLANQHYYDGTVPGSIVVPEWALAVAAVAGLLGGALLLFSLVTVVSGAVRRGPAGVPLLFGLFVLPLTVSYYAFFDSYLHALLPIALLATALPFRGIHFGRALALVGVALFAGWSVWWQRDYLDRRAAAWQAAQALVARGIPPEQIDGGFEWNGWYRGQAVIAAAVARGQTRRLGRGLQGLIYDGLRMNNPRWFVAFAPPRDAAAGRVLAAVPYGRDQYVYAVERP